MEEGMVQLEVVLNTASKVHSSQIKSSTEHALYSLYINPNQIISGSVRKAVVFMY